MILERKPIAYCVPDPITARSVSILARKPPQAVLDMLGRTERIQ
jgi:hypothetical protein